MAAAGCAEPEYDNMQMLTCYLPKDSVVVGL